jgi:hypothetical protein
MLASPSLGGPPLGPGLSSSSSANSSGVGGSSSSGSSSGGASSGSSGSSGGGSAPSDGSPPGSGGMAVSALAGSGGAAGSSGADPADSSAGSASTADGGRGGRRGPLLPLPGGGGGGGGGWAPPDTRVDAFVTRKGARVPMASLKTLPPEPAAALAIVETALAGNKNFEKVWGRGAGGLRHRWRAARLHVHRGRAPRPSRRPLNLALTCSLAPTPAPTLHAAPPRRCCARAPPPAATRPTAPTPFLRPPCSTPTARARCTPARRRARRAALCSRQTPSSACLGCASTSALPRSLPRQDRPPSASDLFAPHSAPPLQLGSMLAHTPLHLQGPAWPWCASRQVNPTNALSNHITILAPLPASIAYQSLNPRNRLLLYIDGSRPATPSIALRHTARRRGRAV